MIRLRGVGHSYATASGAVVESLAGVDFEVERGEFVSVVGKSGCGKSTLLEIMAGLKKPSAGSVEITGRTAGRDFGWAGYLTQADSLLPWRTVLDNACLGLTLRGRSRAERERHVRPILERFGLEGFERAYPGELSGGMLKRASLARVLAYDPEVLLLDEPFAPLDAQTREALHADLLDLWRDSKKTVVLVTHDITEAVLLSGRIAVLGPRPGRIVDTVRVDAPHPRAIFDPRSSCALADAVHRVRRALGSDDPHQAGRCPNAQMVQPESPTASAASHAPAC